MHAILGFNPCCSGLAISTGLSHRAIKVGKMFDRLSPEQQDAMQRIVDALAQQVGNDIADHG